MDFNRHSELEGRHAFLSPSKYHWVNYDDQKLEARYHSHRGATRGTELHAFAQDAIRLGIRMPRTKTTLNMYINDALGFKLEPEVHLFYSPNCFGQADSIGFRNGKLRIHDLKTGITKSSFGQLEIYAGLFCLEYAVDPFEIDIVLRIYQNDEIRESIPTSDHIAYVMDRIVYADQQVEAMKERDTW